MSNNLPEENQMEIDDEKENDVFTPKGNLTSYQETIKKKDPQYIIDEDDNDNIELSTEDSWVVITSFFEEHGLVSQQIGSFNQFLESNIQDIVNENKELVIIPDSKYLPDRKSTGGTRYEVVFGQLHVSSYPYFSEKDQQYKKIFPNEARIRNLTYESALSIDIQTYERSWDSGEKKEDSTRQEAMSLPKAFIGRIPIMVRSKFCALNEKNDPARVDVKECVFDEGPNLSKKDLSLFIKELNAISYSGSDDEDYLSDSDDFSLDTSDNSSVEAPSESYVKKMRTDMKKKIRESINEINDRKPSNEYENFLSEEKVNTMFVLEERKPQKKNKKSIWRKHIEKEIKAVNDSLYMRHTISNEKGFSILRVLESKAIENNSLIRGGSVL